MAEQYYYESALILPLNGPANTTTWADVSARNTKTSAPNGHVADANFGPISGRYAQFDKNFSAYLASTAWSLDIGTADFTIRLRFSPNSLGFLYGLFSLAIGNGSAPRMVKNAADQLVFNGTVLTPAVTATGWHHLEVCRSAGTVYVFLDGTLLSPTIAYATAMTGITQFYLGRDDSNNYWNGGLADFQIISGIALHTASFTPPAVRLDQNTLPVNNKYVTPLIGVQAGSLPASYGAKYMSPAIKLYDVQWGGKGRIYGTTKVQSTPSNAPVGRRVRLYRDGDGVMVREQWSDNVTGAYSFDNMDMNQRYTVVTYDYQHVYRAVVADNITPELMP